MGHVFRQAQTTSKLLNQNPEPPLSRCFACSLQRGQLVQHLCLHRALWVAHVLIAHRTGAVGAQQSMGRCNSTMVQSEPTAEAQQTKQERCSSTQTAQAPGAGRHGTGCRPGAYGWRGRGSWTWARGSRRPRCRGPPRSRPRSRPGHALHACHQVMTHPTASCTSKLLGAVAEYHDYSGRRSDMYLAFCYAPRPDLALQAYHQVMPHHRAALHIRITPSCSRISQMFRQGIRQVSCVLLCSPTKACLACTLSYHTHVRQVTSISGSQKDASSTLSNYRAVCREVSDSLET